MQYYEVLPLSKTGAEDQSFTYEYDGDLRIGSLVTIPLRNRFLRGIVTDVVKKPAFATKSIKKVLAEEPPVTEVQMVLAKKISQYYFSPLGDALNAILPFDFGKKRRTQNQESGIKNLESPLKLTNDQKEIVKKIQSAPKSSKFLLFGVTGSGKTEVYLQLIEDALKKGQGAIVLVPEISLTPQAMERFKKRFGKEIAVWHSAMKETEKYHEWTKIKSGEKRVVVGARSAIFTPIKNLSYIFIDEEHENGYKQDQNPRYEAQKVAEWLTDLTGAKLILGSATPRLENFYKTQNNEPASTDLGEYILCTLNKRIVQEEMPPVKIIDMRDEFKKGNKSILSESLYDAISSALKSQKQALLFVNRRGAATFVVCRDCGYVSQCPNCEVPLVYHPDEGQVLKCHHCEYKGPVPSVCPNCKSYAIRYFGLGTQKAEIEARKLFPKAKIARMDRDTTQKRGSHEEIYQSFAKNDFDILIGTQIIAKGWDLPNVAVVGVISADTTLNLPDFRSGERTFSLLTQVAGRTGRGFHPGQVFIQTYNPENYAIKAAAKHDYEGFYETEIKERQKYNYPPFSHLVKLTYSHADSQKAEKEAEKIVNSIEKELGETGIEILGPVPAFIPKIANKYRWHVVLKIKKESDINIILKKIKPNLVNWTIDINPDNLL